MRPPKDDAPQSDALPLPDATGNGAEPAAPARRSLFRRGLGRIRRAGLEEAALVRAEGRRLLRGAGRVVGVPARAPARLVERRSHLAGLPPGTLSAHEQPLRPASLHVIHYDADALDEHDGVSAEEARALASGPGVTWVNLDNVRDVAAVARVGAAFGLHPLVQEDITHTTQRPKMDVYGDQLFIVLRMVEPFDADPTETYCAGEPGHTLEQVSFVLGPGYVLSFQEDPRDVFETVRQRLRTGSGRFREVGPDYLLYSLLDVLVDHYFITLERIGDATEVFEDLVFDRPDAGVQEAISALRREVVVLRRAIWPLREVLTGLLRDETPGITDRTRVYLKDVYDHLVQAVDILESLRDVLGGLADLYLSALSHRMNEVMKVLTIIGTVFIPLTFIVGVYGMNFDHMPELHTRYGYFVLLGAMVAVAAGTLYLFKRRGWL
ncbi:MAG TPA: magnesium/cobalt transporter CorA [Rubricoccaceae bacterium]|nr:magnesium/cobalt transporter CorA [Rubricoccaceae bacterium]